MKTAPSWKSSAVVGCYLFAAVAANLVVTFFGPEALPITAFVLIPFDLVARDYLHQRWSGNRLFLRMGALILAGSVLSMLVVINAARVAAASFCSFLLAGACDAVAFHMLGKRHPLVRINGSNAASSIVDSIVFPLIAFGIFSFELSSKQAAAKFVGGIVWSILLSKMFRNERMHSTL